jgi:hypothetical protein
VTVAGSGRGSAATDTAAAAGAGSTVRLRRDGARWGVDGSWYRLDGTTDGTVARLADLEGRPWAELRLLASVDTRSGQDETLLISGPAIDETRLAAIRLVWTLASSTWDAKRLVLTAAPETISVEVEVEGSGALTDVTLLGGRVVLPKASGRLMSGAWFESLVAAAPADPGRIVQPAAESTSIGVVSGSEHGRGRWFFTPAPFVVAASRSPVGDPTVVPSGPWLAFGLDAAAGSAGFTEVTYRAVDRGFAFDIDYDGHTRVVDAWRSPALVIAAAADPYAGVAAQRQRLAVISSARSELPARDTATTPPQPPRAARPAWWREPIFCGWGAQCALAAGVGESLAAAPGYATRDHYDGFLAHLEARGVIPGTITIDDKWQTAYGTNEPDAAKWPDLRRWIAERHARDQRVLLWYKAWDPEGLPDDWCVRSSAGVPIGIDPTHPNGEAAVRQSIRRMLAPDELDADGLKIDFTARTPSGRATVHHGTAWGVDLLRALLDIVADEARQVRPDALLVGHTPNVLVADAVGMLRLNDTLRLDDPEPAVDIVPQMRHRASIVRAACPDHLIDTDDWCAPDLAGWRAYAAIKAELGVPALYYATHLDRTGEHFTDADYELIRSTWSAYRRDDGLPDRTSAA